MKRYFALLLLGLALLAGAALFWAAEDGGVTLSPEAPALAASRFAHPLGVNVSLENLDSDQRAAALDAIAAAGVGWVRQRFPWDQIEPVRGAYDWALWDGIVADVRARDLQLVAVLDGSPQWARQPSDALNPLAPPARGADFGAFAAAVAGRYGEQLRYYQVWDEPNIAPHWGSGLVDAADYAGLLREAAVQLRSSDPDALVIAAALAPNVEPGGLNQSDILFLDALYQAGAAPWFDLAAVQPYGFDRPPDDPPDLARLNFRRAELAREVMAQHGDLATPLLLASFGWHALQGDQPADDLWKSVFPDEQASWAAESAGWAQQHWDWMAGMAWAGAQSSGSGENRKGFALTNSDDEPLNVLDALTSGSGEPLGPGFWLPGSDAVTETGGWRLTGQAADPPRDAATGNNLLTIPFQGTGLALALQRGAYWGFLDVTIDGAPANLLPQDGEGRSYLVLHDPLNGQEVVPVASGLADGVHRAEIRAEGGWEQWPLLGVVVSAEDARSLALPGWFFGLLGVVLCALAVAGFSRGREDGEISPAISSLWPALDRTPPLLVFGVAALLWLALALFSGPLDLVALLLLVAWFFLFPASGLFSVAVAAPLFLAPLAVLGRNVSSAEVAVWLAVAALVTRLLASAVIARRSGAADSLRSRLRPSGLDWPVAALLAVAALSLIPVDNFGVAAREFRTVIVAGVLAYALVRLTPAAHVGDAQGKPRFDPWPVVWGIGLGGALVAAWGIFQAVSGIGLIDAEGVLRVRGPFGSPNNLALYLGHALPLLLAVALFGRGRARRLVAALIASVMAVGLVLTFSKGGLLLGLPAAVLFMGFMAGGRWRWIALAAAGLGLLALIPLFATERFAGLFDFGGGTSFFRVQLWQGTLNMLRDHPWQGVGLDNFLYAYRTRYVLPTAWQEINLSHPHNVGLDFWTRLGIPGLVVGIWLFAAAFRAGWRTLRASTGNRWAITLGLLASLVATLIHGTIDNSVFLVDLMLLFMLTLGLLQRMEGEEGN